MPTNNELPDDFLEDIFIDAETTEKDLGGKFLDGLTHSKNDEFRYEVLDQIDYGGMKSIHRAIDKQTRRQVAIAFIRQNDYDDRELRYFIQEAWLTARLQHPNIVPIHDIGISPDGKPYFVMKLLSGENLGSILAQLHRNNPKYKAQYTQRSLLSTFLKVCQAVSYAHDTGIIHLDLKPENIQVSNFGQVLLIDWGIAFAKLKERDEETGFELENLNDLCQTIFGKIKGTPGYIAPEQSSLARTPADEKTDIFGLGAILYSILTHQRPLVKRAKGSVTFAEFPWPDNDHTPEALKAIVHKATQTKPEDRYQSVNELENDVENYLEGRATEAENATIWRLFVLLIKRNKTLASSILTGLIILIIVTVTFISHLRVSQKIAIENEKIAIAQKAAAKKSEKRALENEQKAIAQEQEAKENLERFIAEKKEKEKQQKVSALFYEARSKDHYQKIKLDLAVSNIETALELNPNKNSIAEHALVLFIATQQFNKINETLSQFSHLGFYKIAKKYANIKDDNELLTTTQFKRLLNDIKRFNPSRFSLISCHLYKHVNSEINLKDDTELILKNFKILNPNLSFSYNTKKDYISITGSGEVLLNPFVGLNFKGLELSGQKLNDQVCFRTMGRFEYLNLKDSGASYLNYEYNFRNLKHLNLENCPIAGLSQRIHHTLNYLNIANTSYRELEFSHFKVKVLDIRKCDKLDLHSLLKGKYKPDKIILSQSQLDKYPKFEQEAKRRKTRLEIVD